MSARLQVLFELDELDEIREIARRHRVTVAEWVRTTLRRAMRSEPRLAVQAKLAAVGAAAAHSFPTGDIDQMLEEIERGYRGAAP